MGPLAQLFALLQQQRDPDADGDVHQPVDWTQIPMIQGRQAPPTPAFRDRMQEGPSPPANQPLAAMFGGRSG